MYLHVCKCCSIPCMYIYDVRVWINQEMELILSRPGAQQIFYSEWSMKWAPAIVCYCRSLKRNDIREVLASSEFPG